MSLRPVSRGIASLASVVLLGLVVGCGGSADTDPDATPQSATAVDGAASAAQADVAAAVASADAAASGVVADAANVDADSADERASIESAAATGGIRSTAAATPAAVPTATGSGHTYVVGGTGTLLAGQTRVATMMAVPWGSLPAGSVVLVSAGTYAGVTTITSTGTAANPIIVSAADPANPPVLTNSFDFQHASYVTVSHVTVQQPTYGGFIIRLASNHITVSDSTINRAPMAINITGAAGTGNQILRNTIADSTGDGINAEVNADPANRTLIARNTILRSGQHGIELRASHYQVDYNTVSQSGYANGGGISGIHVFSGSASEDSGDDNLVRYNLSYGNIDRVAVDGNGIEVDQWCDRNTVAFNQVWGNDGAGIIVFDGSSNLVQNNTTWDNGHNSGGTHVALGEIIVSGTSAATVKANHVWNNVSLSTHAGVPALYVDSRAVAGVNAIGANLYFNGAAGGRVVRWTDSAWRTTAATIDATTGATGSVVAAPAFTNTAAPLANGLKLKAKPTLNGLTPTGLVDALGAPTASGDSFFGAYYTAPATTTTTVASR